MSRKMVTRSIGAANLWTDAVHLVGYFNLSISDDWTATVTVQRSFDQGDTWHVVDTWTENAQEYGLEPEGGVYYRVGIAAGDYTAGTCVVRLSQ